MVLATCDLGRIKVSVAVLLDRFAGHVRATGSVALICATLAGCNTLPDSGPTESQIESAQRNPKKNSVMFGIVQISLDLLTLQESEREKEFSKLGAVDSNSFNDTIGYGDTLNVSIYETGTALFGNAGGGASSLQTPTTSETEASDAGQAFAATQNGHGANMISMPPLIVDGRGGISLPYVGRLQVIGLTTEQAATKIRTALKSRSQAPAVVVYIANNIANSAFVYGDVTHPGRIALTPNKERLLDVLAMAQGTTHPAEDSVVQLTRHDKIARAGLITIEKNTSENVQISPGDRLQVIFQPRTLTIFGAAGKVSEVPFEVPELTLAEALARAGGPDDQRADPNAVYVFRYENNNVVSRVGLNPTEGVNVTPVVYQLDMMNPASYFLAQRFVMNNKDMIYIANAKTGKLNKFLGMISNLMQPGISAGYMATRY